MKQYLENLWKTKRSIVILLMAACIIATTAVVVISTGNAKAIKNEQALTDIKNLQSAAYNVGILNEGFSEDLTVLVEELNKQLYYTTVKIDNNTITTTEKDPWGVEYQIRYEATSTAEHLDIVSAGPDKKFNTSDDVVSTIVCTSNEEGKTTVTVVDPEIAEKYETSHICLFNQQIEKDEFLYNSGNCSTRISYYYSCICGKKGTTTFATKFNTNVHSTKTVNTYSTMDAQTHKVYTHCTACNAEINNKLETHYYNSANVCEACSYAAHIHSFTVKDTDIKYFHKAASCEAPMSYYYSCTCKAIGDELFYVGTALEHKTTSTVIDATCIEDGKKVDKCINCQYIAETTLPALGHDFAQVQNDLSQKAPATCNSYAEYYVTCQVCSAKGDEIFYGNEYNSQHHVGTTRMVYDYANEDKHVVNTYCNDCNMSIDKTVKEHEFDSARNCILCNNHVHVFNLQDNLKLKSEATCQDTRWYFYNCVCGETGSMSYSYGNIDKSNHTGNVVFAGEQNSHTINSCCGTLVSSQHTFTENREEPTCNNTGLATYTCECGYSYEQVIPTINHNFVPNMTIETLLRPATCINEAEYYYSCSMCNLESQETFFGEKDLNNHSSVADRTVKYIDENKHLITVTCHDCLAVLNNIEEEHDIVEDTCKQCETHIHNFTYADNLIVRTQATCTAKATYYYNCSCGLASDEYYAAGEVDLENHTESIVLAGLKDIHSRYNCCGMIVIKDHHYTENVVSNPTCETNGVKTYVCDCGYHYDVELPAISHNFVQLRNDVTKIAEATCISPEVYVESCEYCSQRTDTRFTYGDPNGDNHVGQDIVQYLESSVQNEHTVRITCDACTEVKSEYQKEHIFNDVGDCLFCNAHKHVFVNMDNLVKKLDATCQNRAAYYYNCYCGAISEEAYDYGEINKNNHTGVLVTTSTENTCQTYSCCGVGHPNHKFEETILQQATCTEQGLNKYSCITCGYSYEELVSVLPHTFEKNINEAALCLPATCINPASYYKTCKCGYKSHETFTDGSTNDNHVNIYNKYSYCDSTSHSKLVVCADCGHSVEYIEEHILDSTLACSICQMHIHNFDREIVHERYFAASATCTSPALYYRSCVCGDASDECFTLGEALGHEPIFCGNDEIHMYCKHCKFIIQDASYHVFTEGTVLVDATCSKPGTQEVYCECGYRKLVEIPKVNHNYNVLNQSEQYLKVKPSCLMNAVYYYACECGAKGTDSYVAYNTKIPHSYTAEVANDKTLVKAPTCNTPGLYIRICSYCKALDTDLNNTFPYGDVNKYNHEALYNKYSSIDAETHSVLSVCAACSTTEGPVSAPHNWDPSITVRMCKDCGYSTHQHVFEAIPNENTFISAATCTQYAKYYMSCQCGVMSTNTFTYGDLEPHEETFAGSAAVHSICKVCNQMVSTEHEMNVIETLSRTENRDALYNELVKVYGTGSDVKYSTAAHSSLRYVTNVMVGNKNVTVYVSQKPTINPEIAINNPYNMEPEICYALRQIYGSYSGVAFSFEMTNKCRYRVEVTLPTGGTRVVYASALIGETQNIPLDTCPTSKTKTYFCDCGYSYTTTTSAQHVSDGDKTCTKGASCKYCHLTLTLPKGHGLINIVYTKLSLSEHQVDHVCRDCNTIINTYVESHSMFWGCEYCSKTDESLKE